MRNLAAIVPLCLFLICALRTEADGQHASSRVSTLGASNQNCQSALPDTDHGSTGQEREQRPQVSKQLQHPENQVGAILERATNYLKHREFDKCARELSAAAKLAPQSPRVWLTYGSLNLDQSHAEEALKF